MKPITADIDLVAAGPHGGHHGQEDTTMPKSQTPLHNAYVTPPPPQTPPPAAFCLACSASLPPGRARQYCNTACRQAGWRRRHQNTTPITALPEPKSRRTTTIYQCPICENRYLGDQRCQECNRFCTRLGPGGMCPCCDEPITVQELLQN